MAQPLNSDQQRLVLLATTIANQPLDVRRADIVEMVTIIKRLTQDQQIAVINSIIVPQALRYLSTAGISGLARTTLLNKLIDLGAKGIK